MTFLGLTPLSGTRMLQIVSACALAAITSTIIGTTAQAAQIAGQATVVDGDTIEVAGTRIRLFGIDAPEADQTCHDDDGKIYRCGQAATDALSAFLAQKPIICDTLHAAPNGATVATCAVGDVDISDWVVRKGYGLDWPAYSKGRYGDAQKAAERSGDGLWGGQWVTPWQYRDCRRAGGRAESCSESAMPTY
jgi:endonuclease YncB( thermonuclease family)